MKALIQFWLDMKPFILTAQDRYDLDDVYNDWSKMRDWMVNNRSRIGLHEHWGFIHWDKVGQAFYVQESNGRKIEYLPGGFETPDYLPDPDKYLIEAVTATVYFESLKGIQNGEYDLEIDGSSIKAVLSMETLKDGVVRHTLHIGRCHNLSVLSRVASRIRSGAETPKVIWP